MVTGTERGVMVILGTVIDRLGEMQRRAGLFVGRPEKDAEFRVRCQTLGRTILTNRNGRLSPETVLDGRAEQVFDDLCLWFGLEVGG